MAKTTEPKVPNGTTTDAEAAATANEQAANTKTASDANADDTTSGIHPDARELPGTLADPGPRAAFERQQAFATGEGSKTAVTPREVQDAGFYGTVPDPVPNEHYSVEESAQANEESAK